MPRKRKKLTLKKRNLAAKAALRQPSAGPMKDKRRPSRRQQRERVRREAEEESR